MKKIFLSIFCCMMSFMTFAYYPTDSCQVFPIDLSCQQINQPMILHGTHRTPVVIPIVFLNPEMGILYFETPCYECTLELVIPGTETAVYTYTIPDGDDSVTLPDGLSGMYELHIHRGNYCFYATIEL